MYVLALIVVLAAGGTELRVLAPGGNVMRFPTKEACKVRLGQDYDRMVKESPEFPFALACVTPDQYDAMRKRMDARDRETLKL